MDKDRVARLRIVKSASGHYSIGTLSRALKLQRTDPRAWRRLPRALRTEAEQAPKLFAAEIQPIVHALIEKFERLHPKLLDLAKHDQRVGELTPDQLARIPEAVVEHIKVPGHRGRHQDPETLKRLRVMEEFLKEGLNPSQIIRRERPDLSCPEKAQEFKQERNRLCAFIRYHKLSSR